jgi:hypothetical protein
MLSSFARKEVAGMGVHPHPFLDKFENKWVAKWVPGSARK